MRMSHEGQYCWFGVQGNTVIVLPVQGKVLHPSRIVGGSLYVSLFKLEIWNW